MLLLKGIMMMMMGMVMSMSSKPPKKIKKIVLFVSFWRLFPEKSEHGHRLLPSLLRMPHRCLSISRRADADN